MARIKGMKVVVCDCGAQVVGFPGEDRVCAFCHRNVKIPKAKQEKSRRASENL